MLLIDVQRKKGCAERIPRVTSESYYRVPSLQHFSVFGLYLPRSCKS
jgi:hypothetical protein